MGIYEYRVTAKYMQESTLVLSNSLNIKIALSGSSTGSTNTAPYLASIVSKFAMNVNEKHTLTLPAIIDD